MDIKRSGSQPSGKGPAEYFTGTVRMHGATATMAITHIAIQEHLDGKVVECMEKVNDEQYQAGLRAELKETSAELIIM